MVNAGFSRAFLAALLGLSLVPSAASAVCTTPAGDVNGNGEATVSDVQCAILSVLWELGGSIPGEVPGCVNGQLDRADANCDSIYNVSDVTLMINFVLNGSVDPILDADGNACVDACENVDLPYTNVADYTECDAGDLAWAQRSIETVLGRKPYGHYEAQVLADLAAAVGRENAALGLTYSDQFEDRWAHWIMDQMRVNRMGSKSQNNCFSGQNYASDQGQIAAYVRDNAATSNPSSINNFRMTDLLYSSLRLDDLSPVYRAYIFAMLSEPLTGANVAALDLDITRRQDFGEVFSAVYLNRNTVCAQCHNSLFSVTDSFDPATDRHWPMPGLFEEAVFGQSWGRPEMEVYTMFRHLNVVGGSSADRPWNMSSNCGTFQPQGSIPNDPAGYDGFFIQDRGAKASVWQVEAALRSGFDKLRADGLQVAPGGAVDGEEGFAYLVAANIVDEVWTEATGYSLTLVHHFPRNQDQRDILIELTQNFVANGFSLKELLVDVTTHPLFNQPPPSAGCAVNDSPYVMAAVFNPWINEEPLEEMRANSVGDMIHRHDARVMLRSVEQALGWDEHPQFVNDGSGDAELQKAIGVFLKDGEPGFDGVDFQGMLAWENEFGACGGAPPTTGGGTTNPACTSGPPSTSGDNTCGTGSCGGQSPASCYCDTACTGFGDCCNDYQYYCVEDCGSSGGGGSTGPDGWVSDLVTAAQGLGEGSVTVGDLAGTLKDRLVANAVITDAEGALIADFFGAASIDTPLASVADWETRVFNYCGALLESPQFLVAGVALSANDAAPAIVVNGQDYDYHCQQYRDQFDGNVPVGTIDCSTSPLSVP